MTRLPPSGFPASLSIAFWLVASLWIVAIVAHALDAPPDIVYAAFGFGVLGGIAEWLAIRRIRR